MRIGFIGAGSMAEALIKGLLNSGTYDSGCISCSDISEDRLQYIRENYGVAVHNNNQQVFETSKVVILAVKPDTVRKVLTEGKEKLNPEQLVISIAAGISTRALENWLGSEIPVVRVMPNTPCLLGKGVSAVSRGRFASGDHEKKALEIFACVGETVCVPEKLMNAVTGVSGSGPAYIYLVIEALIDAGVALGIPRNIATKLVAETVRGSAEMVCKTGQHPALLKAQVVSPGGTTAAGLNELEEGRMRALFAKAAASATRKAEEIGE